MRGCEILKVDAVSRPQASNGSLTMWQPPSRPFLFSTASHVSLVHIHQSILDLDLASLLRTTSSEVLSESTNRQHSRHSSGSFDLDPLGVDQSWGCNERAALTRLKRRVLYVVWI